MATQCAIIHYFLCIIVLFSLFLNSTVGLGFSIDLIHRDSPASPFYNSSLSPFEHLKNNIIRSHERVNRFNTAYEQKISFSSPLSPVDYNYLMEFTIGTPPVTIRAMADTGSDIIWTQCKPCKNCFKQDFPIFNPESSSTYKTQSCHSNPCQSIQTYTCGTEDICMYNALYADGTYSSGILSSDTLTFDSSDGNKAFFRDLTFGCGFDNAGASVNEHVSGIVGLGTGPLSLISQLKNSINGKFSHCLVPLSKVGISSRLNFGDNAVVSGLGVVKTPLFLKPNVPLYFLSLEGMTIGDHRIEYLDSLSTLNGNPEERIGNIVIDSGTTLTYLPTDLFNHVRLLVMNAIKTLPIADPHNYLSLCYKLSDNPSFPTIIAHFTGADVTLSPQNTFIPWDRNLMCLAIAPSTVISKTNPLSLFGNIAQANFLIGYDLNQRTVSFKRTECGRV